MSKTKINFRDPKTSKRRIGCLDNDTKRVSLSDGRKYSLKYLKSKDKNGIGFFGTWIKGKKIQDQGEIK
jgi:hypothetical protein